MKYANKLLAPAAVWCLLFMMACGGNDDDGPTPEPGESDAPGAALVGTWAADSAEDISYDGQNPDIASQFSSFTISMDTTDAGVAYTTTNNPQELSVFPQSGTLSGIEEDTEFTGDGATVTRGPDNVPMTVILSEDEQTLTLRFTIPEANAGVAGQDARVNEVSGQYTFELAKQ